MTPTTAVDRARGDFVEMPGLELTLPQAARLWDLDDIACRTAIDTLVEAGFLRWTTRRTIMRTGLELPVPATKPKRTNSFVEAW